MHGLVILDIDPDIIFHIYPIILDIMFFLVSGRKKANESFNTSSDEGTVYLEAMKSLATAASLPRAELMYFDGNPLNYFLFVNSFENNVEKNTQDFSKRLQLVIQY